MFSLAKIASFAWFRHFFHRFGGSDVARPQKDSIESGVLRDSRIDCAMSYRNRFP